MHTSIKQVALGCVLVVGALLAQIQAQTPTPTPAAPPIKLALTSLKPDAVIDAGADARITVTADAVWISDRSTGNLRKVDPKTNTSSVTLQTGTGGKGPCQPLVSAFKTLWVALCDSRQLHRFEPPPDPPAAAKPATDKPATDKPATDKPAEEKKTAGPVGVEIRAPGPLVMGTGSIWMITDTAGTLARIDPDTNAVVAEISIPGGANAIAFGTGAVWLTSLSGNTVTRVNAATNVVEESIKVGRGPVSVAVGEGSVWTMNGGDSTVSRIDPKTNKVTETIKSGVAGTSGTIVVGEGSVWLSASGTPLTRIDPAANRMVQQFVGPGGGILAIGLKSLWLGATPTAIWRIDPKRVEATRR